MMSYYYIYTFSYSLENGNEIFFIYTFSYSLENGNEIFFKI